MTNKDAVDILQNSNLKLLQCINKLQDYPIEAMDQQMQNRHKYTLKNALLEMEAVEMAIIALEEQSAKKDANTPEQSLIIKIIECFKL